MAVNQFQRNERGQFLPRNPDDTSIAVVLQEHEDKRSAADDAEKDKVADEGAARRSKREPKTFKVDGAAAEFYEDFLGVTSEGDDADKSKEDGKGKEPDKSKEKPVEKDKAAEKVKEKPKEQQPPPRLVSPRQPAPHKQMSNEEITTLAAETAARVNKEGAKKEEPDADLSPTDQRKIAILKHLEQANPSKYKDAPKRFLTAQSKLRNYAAKWESDHPGNDFDETADEHEPFFAANDLYEFWDADEYDEARIDMLAARRSEEKFEERNKEINKKLSKLERAEALRSAEPKIHAEQLQAAKWIWKAYGDDYADYMTDHGSNKEKHAALVKADPVGFSHRLAAAQDLHLEAQEVTKLFNNLIDFDQENPIHVEMSTFAENMEKLLLASPIEDRTDAHGRTFLPADKYLKLKPEDRENHWRLTARDVIFKRAQTLAKKTENSIKSEKERLQKFAEASGWTPPKEAEGRKDADKGKKDKEAVKEADNADEKPDDPSSASASRMAELKISEGKDNPNSQKNWHDDI